MGDDILGVSASERDRLHVIRLVAEKQLCQRAAGEWLELCIRQVKRLVGAFRRQGAAGLVSKQRGRISPQRTGVELHAKIAAHLRDKYVGFGPTLAAEKPAEIEKIDVSRKTIRRMQIALGLWKPKSRKDKRVFQLRDRRPRYGELVQIDGSSHDWFEGRTPRCTLIVFIDDATGRLMGLHFTPTETAKAYLTVLKQYVLAHGAPLAFYSDRHGIFRVNAKDAASGDGKTEFNRVTDRLKIEQICALTPQAKGRVERANQTLQDRLAKEMRLQSISTMAQAEGFFPAFIKAFNARFGVTPSNPANAHRPWTGSAKELDEVLARREERVLSKALTFRCGGVTYAIEKRGPGLALRGAKVTLLRFMDGEMQVRYKDRILNCAAVKASPVPSPAEDEKTLDARVDACIARLAAESVAQTAQAQTSGAQGCG